MALKDTACSMCETVISKAVMSKNIGNPLCSACNVKFELLLLKQSWGPESIAYPDYDFIFYLCENKVRLAHDKFRNNWTRTNNFYWRQRLKDEMVEYANAKTIKVQRSKLINIINMAAMAFDSSYGIPVNKTMPSDHMEWEWK